MASGDGPVSRVTTGMARKLAAILSADVVGYSRLMGEDEEATIHTLTTYRGVMTTFIQQYRGRVVDSPGDNLLAEFASVLDAVQCAVAIQQELHARNTSLPLQRRMQFRLGINLGDVIPDGERIYGDGVNIAARMESLAEAGGICISGTVYDQIATKLALGYEFMGERVVKNIAGSVRVYRVQTQSRAPGFKVRQRNRLGAEPWRKIVSGLVGLLLVFGGAVASWQLFHHRSLSIAVAPAQQAVALPLPDKPSIAVLPFDNLSGDPGQEYVSDGMTEDLITELSRLAGLFVISRHSVYTYKGKAVKPDRVSRELGVRYVVAGSVRKANDRLRITAQLVDATTGYHLWAERYDGQLQDIFAVQEEIARRITRALAARLTQEETEHMGRPYTTSVTAWEYFMRGAEFYRRSTKEANAQARGLFTNAISLDPKFARAYANLAATYRQDWTFGWADDLITADTQALEQAEKAVALAHEEEDPKPSLPYAYQQLAYVYMYRENHEEALKAAQKAVQYDSNYADGYAVLAQILIYDGQPQEAIDKMKIAMRLNPKYPPYYPYHLGQAYYVMEQYEDAEKHLLEARGSNPNYRPARAYLAAVYIAQSIKMQEEGHGAGAQALEEKAKAEMAMLVSLGRKKALFTEKRRVAPYKNEGIAQRLLDAWERAGG